MTLRYLPPVYSPLTAGAVVAGWRGALLGPAPGFDLLAELLAFYGARSGLLTDSGTSALALALKLVSSRRAGPVALPAWSCYDLATAADQAGAEVLLYDLDPGTLGPDWSSLSKVLSQGATAVVAVHHYGVPVDLPEIQRRAAQAGVLVIEDAAQAIGAKLAGRPAGAGGALGVLSFGRGKGLTGGSGGALLLNSMAPRDLALPDPGDLSGRSRGFGSALKLTLQWLLGRPELYIFPASLPFLKLGQTLYREPHTAGALSSSASSVLRRTWPLQADEADRRRRYAAQLREAVSRTGAGAVPVPWEGGTAGWLRLPVIAGDAARRAVDSSPARRLGVWPGYPRLLRDLPGFARRVRNGDAPFPGARALVERLITLPTHGLLRQGDLRRLTSWLERAGTAASGRPRPA